MLFRSGLAEDVSGRAIRYRNGSSLSFDSTAKLVDENGAWTLPAGQLGRLALLQSGSAAFNAFTITATLTVTNVPADGQWLAIKGNVRSWYSNQTASASVMGTGTSANTTATNLYSALTNYGLAGPVTISSVSNAVVRMTGFTNQVMSVLGTGWASVSYATNSTSLAVAVFSPVYSAAPVVTVSGGTNDLPYVIAVATNYVVFGASTNTAVVKWISIGAP